MVLLGYEACQKVESEDSASLPRWLIGRVGVHDDDYRHEALAGTDHPKHVDRIRTLSIHSQREEEPGSGCFEGDSRRASLSFHVDLGASGVHWNWSWLVASVAVVFLAWLASLGTQPMVQKSGIGIPPVFYVA